MQQATHMTKDERWQPIDTCPMGEWVLVAFHGHGENRVKEVSRIRNTGKWPEFYWGDFDYINSHDGEPKYWMPLPKPPNDMAGPNCGCDGCTERYYDPDSPDYIRPALEPGVTTK